jgi:hypothetical protein
MGRRRFQVWKAEKTSAAAGTICEAPQRTAWGEPGFDLHFGVCSDIVIFGCSSGRDECER